MEKLTPQKLEQLHKQKKQQQGNLIRVGMSSCGIAAGAQQVYSVLKEEVSKRGLPVSVEKCGCLGMCYAEPLVEVQVEGVPTVIYGKVNPEVALKILEKHVVSKMLVNDYIFTFQVE
ncbi:MAG: (2Fe-2S) ferredoxin domain-containing protein [Candidatus Omnitrophica bacterium]|nr:(2Fe-2S) ferredoxin domain-containing protein [Candidatus Omnitrophota bacterium]